MTLLLLLITQPSDADQVLARFTQYMTKANSLSVQVKAHPGGDKIVGTGTLTYQRPSRLLFDMTTKSGQYLYALNEEDGMELDRGQQMYDEFPSPGGLAVVPSSLSWVLAVGLPYPLLKTDLRKLVPPGTMWKLKSKATINGVVADVVAAHYEQGDRGDVVASIDSAGRLLKLTIFRESPQGTVDLRYDLSNYISNPQVSASKFTLSIPKGYVPHSMPAAPDPIRAGEAVPLGSWSSTTANGRVDLASLARGKPVLVVVADADSAPSTSMLHALAASAQKTKDKGGVFAVVSTAKDKASAQRLGVSGTLYDPSGLKLRQLRLPGTPLVYLIGRDGKLVQAWFGYDPAADAAFQKEIADALPKAGVK